MTSSWLDILIDTNVLVYPLDPRDRTKQRQANRILMALLAAGSAVLSAQCLTEYFNAVTKRLPLPLTSNTAARDVADLACSFRIVPVTSEVVVAATAATVQHQLSIWDAQIWAAAKLNGIGHILTEDMQHGRTIDGVRYHNPFAPAFDLAALRP